MAARTFAIGDIHGCATALDTLLARIAPQRGDRLVFLGDYVDRGPDSAQVIMRLLELSAACDATFIKGNHEELMLAARTDADVSRAWSLVGGAATARSYASAGLHRRELDEHFAFLEAARDWYETDSHIFVHAPVLPDLPVAKQSAAEWRWSSSFSTERHESGKQVVCGHCAQRTGLPLRVGGTLCIDTWAHGGEWLTAWDIASGDAIQSNDRGESRLVHPNDFTERGPSVASSTG